MSNTNTLSDFNLMTIVNTVSPKYEDIVEEIKDLRKSNPGKNNKELSEIYGKRIRNKYTSVGAATALPSIIPGLGTAVQVGVEITSITADLALMLRWMATMCCGIAIINNKDIKQTFNQEFVQILGIWCGVINISKVAVEKLASKVVVVQLNKHVSGKVLQAINRKVGFTIITKYGSKRGGIALGKLIPFGVGLIVGGGFNYAAMNRFKNSASNYFLSNDTTVYTFKED